MAADGGEQVSGSQSSNGQSDPGSSGQSSGGPASREPETVWIQVDGRAPDRDDGVGRTVKVSRSEDRVARAVATLGEQFRQSMASAIEINAKAVRDAAARLDQPPKELELSFGLALLAEGNFAVTKLSGDANFSVRMVWRDEHGSK